ncbi:MAG: hypothetical protein DDG59_12660 [Anaerolineae bacterium]|jgi:hypothetical protein|nr:MAG: hypothetical protein DDG59_12660 [Anaerolineae bacterium]
MIQNQQPKPVNPFPSRQTVMNPRTKLGLFYFSDDQHYHTKQREKWLAEIASLGVGWLILTNENLIAIPEPFIKDLFDHGLIPILRMGKVPTDTPKLPAEFELLIKTYADWGIKYVQIFDRPNHHAFWGAKGWANSNLVDHFIDVFLPYAEVLVKHGIHPIFPCLEVAKGFWDTAFLRLALESIQRRQHQWLIDHLILSAYVPLYDPLRPLNWGAGGPERWSTSKPYQNSLQTQDQRGLYIADWYETLARTVFGKGLPIVLIDDPILKPQGLTQEQIHQRTYHAIQRLFHPLSEQTIEIDGLRYEPLAEEMLCLSFCGLSSQETEEEPRAWYSPNGEPRPIVKTIKAYLKQSTQACGQQHRIPHALLLPQLGAEQLHEALDRLKPFLIQYQPKIIFNLQEAFEAETVWIPSALYPLSDAEKAALKDHACLLQLINPDGTRIASYANESSLEVL